MKLTKQLIVIGAVIIAAIILSAPFVFRELGGNSSLISQESYFHLAVAQNIVVQNSYPVPETSENLFHYLAAGLLRFIPPALLAKTLPFFLGLIAAALFASIMNEFGQKTQAAISSLLFIISPLFIVVFTTFNPYSLLLCVLLLSWLLFLKKSWLFWPVLAITVFIDASGFIIAAFALLAQGLIQGRGREVLTAFSGGLIVIFALMIGAGYHAKNALITQANLSTFFVSLGSGFGYSLFILILSFIGLAHVWSRKNRTVAAMIIIVALFLVSFATPVARIIMLPVTALFGALGVLVLVRRNWSVERVRHITLFLIALNLLFTFTLTLNNQTDQSPSLETIQALNFLKTVPEGELVLSSAKNGVFIERIARRPAFIDLVERNPLEKQEVVAEQIFYSTNIDRTRELLRQHTITHIFIDQEMREGGVWSSAEQGLLFFIKNNDDFVELYNKGEIQIYRFIS